MQKRSSTQSHYPDALKPNCGVKRMPQCQNPSCSIPPTPPNKLVRDTNRTSSFIYMLRRASNNGTQQPAFAHTHCICTRSQALKSIRFLFPNSTGCHLSRSPLPACPSFRPLSPMTPQAGSNVHSGGELYAAALRPVPVASARSLWLDE